VHGLRRLDVKRHQAGQRQINLFRLIERDRIGEAAQPLDVFAGQRHWLAVAKVRPLGAGETVIGVEWLFGRFQY
jgi:hypothetical protein